MRVFPIYAQAPGLLQKKGRGGVIVLDKCNNKLHSLNSTGAAVFLLCDGRRTCRDIALLLQEEFGMAEPPYADVLACLDTLQTLELIQPLEAEGERTIVNRFAEKQKSRYAQDSVDFLSPEKPEKTLRFIDDITARLRFSCATLLTSHSQTKYLPQAFRYPLFNPSVIAWQKGLLFVSRCTNEIMLGTGMQFAINQIRETQNVLCYYDNELSLTKIEVIDDSLLQHELSEKGYQGFEDARVFEWKGGIWLLAAARFPNAYKQVLLKLEGKNVVNYIVINSPRGVEMEKNWIPLVKGLQLFFIYKVAPTIVFELVNERSLELVKGDPTNADEGQLELRGGTQFIPWSGGYLGVAHDTPFQMDGMLYYTHRFIVIDDKFRVREVSNSFFIQHKGVEFATGMAILGGKVLISYGLQDRAAAFVSLPDETLSEWIATGREGVHPLVGPTPCGE
ncbi:hypothetical protein AMST5_00868 [freshwater sediment metagenome]|uniref:PqqD family protein n=1 Tax=freshwater sediment metagenome TaxID=556182 RepID=A0AA48RD69_9ZZZZ